MLFKDELNIDLAEIKQYLSVSQNGSYAKIKPHIAAAEILYIKDLLGEDLYNRLHEWYHSEESGSTSGSASASFSASASASVSPEIRTATLSGVYDELTGYIQYTVEANFIPTSLAYVRSGGLSPTLNWPYNFLDQDPEAGDNIYAIVNGDGFQVESNYCYVIDKEGGGLEVVLDEIIIIDDPFKGMMMPMRHGGMETSGSLSASGSGSIQVETEAALAAILPLVQNVLINFSYYIGADELGVHISDAGIQIISDETHKQAFQWQVNAAKASWLNKAYLFSDVLLSYLESHADEYPSWKNSECFTRRLDSLLYTTGQFNDEYFIKNSRRLFLALKPIIRSIESKYAVPTLSQEFYDEILASIRANTVSADDQVILKKIRPAIAHLAMAEAITRFAFEVFPEAVYANIVSAFGTIDGKNPAGKIDKALAVDSLNSDGNAELAGLQKYLDANASASKYKTYFDSSRYSDPATTPNRSEFVNSADKGIFLA